MPEANQALKRYLSIPPEQRLKVVEDNLAVMRTSGGMTMTTKELLVHPAHETLVAHQKDCARCAAVRDWIAIESLEGRVRDQADINRIGEYVIKHACPEGVALNEAVGRAMREG